MDYKSIHKTLKTKVNVTEEVRNNDRSYASWHELRELKKQKLQAKDRLHGVRNES